MERRLILLITLVIGLLLSGCITIHVESKVGKDCKIEHYRISMNMSSYVYNLLQQEMAKKGYSSYREYFYSSISPEYRDRISYNEVWHGNYVSIVITARDIPPDNKNIIVVRKNGKIFYKDNIFNYENVSALLAMGGTIRYSLEMPGKIVESNANTVNGNRAEWHITRPITIYAVSEAPSIPGFDSLTGVLGVAIVVGLLLCREKRKKSA